MISNKLQTDKELINLLSEGSKSAFNEIWNRYWEKAFNEAYKRLKDEEQCRDVVQDFFIDLWIRKESLAIDNLGGYINSAIRYKVFKLLAEGEKKIPFYEVFESIATSAVRADNKILDKELEALANQWLDTLPKKRKAIFILHFGENLSTNEIALKLGITQKTVQNQLGLASTSFQNDLLPLILTLILIS